MFRGVSRGGGGGGALGPNAQNFRGVKFFFALHLILGGKVHICGRDDLFLLFKFASLPCNLPYLYVSRTHPQLCHNLVLMENALCPVIMVKRQITISCYQFAEPHNVSTANFQENIFIYVNLRIPSLGVLVIQLAVKKNTVFLPRVSDFQQPREKDRP